MISCVIPVYEMFGCGVEMLRELIESIRAQTFTDYEIVVSNFVTADSLYIWPQSDFMAGVIEVPGKQGAAANLNNAIDHAKGDIIKPMFQDDKFMEPDSLQKIADAFTGCQCDKGEIRPSREGAQIYRPTHEQLNWIACTSHNEGLENYDHVPCPHTTLQYLREGENTYGSPSAIAYRRNDLTFDENLHWLFDCEFYARMCEKYGTPRFVDTKIFIRQWDGQATRTLCDGAQRIADANEVIEKYRDRGGVARA